MTAIAAGAPARARSRENAGTTERRHRYAFWSLLAVTAVLYLIGLSRNGWANDFYAAAVQAGTKSWKAFFFGSFDASSFITVDKTPASMWVMELSARLFGLNYWSVLAPQALEGVASVALLYAAVRRWHGPWAGLIAGAALAVTPVAALMFRYNNPDALLTLLITAAAYAMVRAIESGRTRWLVFAGALLGFGFLTKMLQAFLVLPPFGFAYLVAAPRRWPARLGQLLAGLAAVLVAAGWWVAAVMLTPAADRPYVGGSTNDSILQLALGYNGLGRIDGNETGSVGFTGNRGAGPGFSGSAGLGRLFAADMGGQISWLLPAALIGIGALGWLAWRARRARQADRDLPAVLIWGGWLVVTGLVFSFMAGIIHPYYTVALAPAIGALVGIGAVRLWQVAGGSGRAGQPARYVARYVLAAGIACTAAWSFALLERSSSWLPPLRYAVLVLGLASAAAMLVSPRLGARAGAALRRRAVAGIVAGTATVAALAGPAAYTLDTIAASHAGALPTAGPAVSASFGGGGAGGPAGLGAAPGAGGLGRAGNSGQARGTFGGAGGLPGSGAAGSGTSGSGTSGSGTSGTGTRGQPGSPGTGGLRSGGPGGTGGGIARGGAAGGGGLGGSTTVSSALTRLLKQGTNGYTWVAATVGSESAAPLQLATGDAVMSIGGFNGTDPAPTLAQFEQLVAEQKIHYFVGTNSDSFGGGTGDAQQITNWVASHFTSQTVGGETIYNLAKEVSS
jgi:4-amino-4-deoxy-L-arabinose transferase-like glycosyltransferase